MHTGSREAYQFRFVEFGQVSRRAIVCGLLAASTGALGGLRGLVTVRSILGKSDEQITTDEVVRRLIAADPASPALDLARGQLAWI
mgnify:CR=1 FL=1